MILGVIAGFFAWSILWVGSDQVLMASMGWYAQHQLDFQRALFNQEPFVPNNTVLLMHLVRSVIVSLIAGYLAALVAGENRRSPLILGVVLLLVGIFVQAMAWSYLPIWYHLIFLLLIIPVTVAGGKLRSAAPALPQASEV
jgi:hypothetical protein